MVQSDPPFATRREIPYNELPLLPPRFEVETARTLKAAIGARTAVAELKAVGRSIPNQGMLIRSLILQEAKLSSEIENIVTTNDDLYQALSRDEGESNPFVKEVLRYSDAVWFGMKHIGDGKRFDTPFYCRLASIIKNADIDVRERHGTRIGKARTREVIYTPPSGRKIIEDLLENLNSYYQDVSSVDPLIRMAVAHYQFEAIHPFSDGNGRTGRVVNILWMIQQNLLDMPTLFLSSAILDDRTAYYDALRRVTEEWKWEEWIVYLLAVVESTAIDTRRRIEAISKGVVAATALIEETLPRVQARVFAELLYAQPYVRLDQLEEARIAKRHAGAKYLSSLEKAGLLEAVKVGRHVLYLNRDLLDILGA